MSEFTVSYQIPRALPFPIVALVSQRRSDPEPQAHAVADNASTEYPQEICRVIRPGAMFPQMITCTVGCFRIVHDLGSWSDCADT